MATVFTCVLAAVTVDTNIIVKGIIIILFYVIVQSHSSKNVIVRVVESQQVARTSANPRLKFKFALVFCGVLVAGKSTLLFVSPTYERKQGEDN